MGCFLGCFGASKDDKRRLKNSPISHRPHLNNHLNTGKQYSPIHQNVVPEQEFLEEPIQPPILETRVMPEEEKLSLINQGKQEEQLTSGARKRVTFDATVKEYEHVSSNETPEILEENEILVECTKTGNSSSASESGSTLSSLGSFPPNHRYQNCRDSDDDELECVVSDLEDEDELDKDDDEAYDTEYSDDEYYTRQVPEISIRSCSSKESRTRSSATCATNDMHGSELQNGPDTLAKETNTPPEFNRGARDRAGYVHSVLNPVENTAQWKILKAKRTPPLKHQKENFEMDLGLNQSSSKSKPILDGPENKYEVGVDASLLTWLHSSQKTPPIKAKPINFEPISSGSSMSSHGSNSVRLEEERPILGTLTTEELSQDANEKPLVGTVGIHWTDGNDWTPVEDSGSASSFKGIPNTTSKYREDKSVNWHSTPFETRLERALNGGATDSCT